MKMLMKYTALVALALVANAALAQVSAAVKELQRDWAQANYVLQGERYSFDSNGDPVIEQFTP